MAATSADRTGVLSRRQALRTMFCASAALTLNLRPQPVRAGTFAANDRHLLMLGDFGSGNDHQKEVAAAMRKHVRDHHLQTSGLLLLGDNFYGKMPGGIDCPRWKTGFEDMYPAAEMPGPAWVVMGNHDYHDSELGDLSQLGYAAAHPGTRWTLPARWYRVDFPGPVDPLVTFLFLDSNFPAVSGGLNSKTAKLRHSLTAGQENEQNRWLEEQLAGPRARFTVVAGHHPLYSNGSHGDTKTLVKAWGPLFEEHGVHLYLCGHDHDLQHLELKQKRTSFVLSGGGGAKVRDLEGDHPAPFAKPVHGFSQLQINPDRLVVRHFNDKAVQLHAFEKRPDFSVQLLDR